MKPNPAKTILLILWQLPQYLLGAAVALCARAKQVEKGEWVDWVSDVIEREVYAEETNDARTYTNVDAIYKRIRIAFYHNLIGQNQ